MASIMVHILKKGSVESQRNQVANLLRTQGYSVDTFATVVCVKGKAKDGKLDRHLTKDEAHAARMSLEKYRASPREASHVRVDIVY